MITGYLKVWSWRKFTSKATRNGCVTCIFNNTTKGDSVMSMKTQSTIIILVSIFVTLFFLSLGNAQVIFPSVYGAPVLPVNISYIPDPFFTLGGLPPIYPYVGDTIAAFDSFVWPAGAVVPPTSLAEISYAVPGTFSGFPGLTDPQIYLSTFFPTYVDYLNLYFAAALAGSTLPGAFGPFGLPSVTAYSGLATIYPYFNYGDISSLIAYYALNPIASSYAASYPLIL
jgi:hypothetical protein